MTDKLAVIILDALDDYNTKQLDMEYIDKLITEKNSEVLGVSTLPYTAQSNPMIWGGYDNEDKFWVKPGTDKWSFPAGAFNREKGQVAEKAEKAWEREDFNTAFIWDDLAHQGVDASALHIPIVLPPYSYNPLESFDMGDHWFPHSSEQIEAHAEEMPETIKQHAEKGKNFIASSIQLPDKPLHAMGEDLAEQKEAKRICSKFDRNMKELVKALEENSYDWLIFGDHGSPWPGNVKIPETKQFVPNHRKSSVIISNRDDWDLPTYTEELHGFMKEKFDVEKARPDEETQQELEQEAVECLKQEIDNYSPLFMFTGGKESLVVSHMLLNRVGEEGEQPVPYGVIDTGNHFDEVYDFRNKYAEQKGIDLEKKVYTELLQNVILNDDDPRGYHGMWDDGKELPEDLPEAALKFTSPEDWGVEQSCGALKVNGIRQFIEDGYNRLITGQRGSDPTATDGLTLFNQRSKPESHTRINPLANWSKENVWRYIDKHGLEYPILYDKGYNHTDSKCCTQKPNDLDEYGQQGADIVGGDDADSEEIEKKLKKLGYI